MKTKLLLAAAACLAITTATNAQTWEKLNFNYDNEFLHVFKLFPSPDDNVLVTGISNAARKVRVSTDGGNTWQEVFADKAVFSAEFGPSGKAYLITARQIINGSYVADTVFRSDDGTTWANTGTALKGGRQQWDFTVSGNGTLLFPNHMGTNGPALSKSTDNGATWSPTEGKITATACSYSADTIVQSHDSPWPGGVKYSHDGGATFNIATGINATNIPVYLPNGDIYAATVGQVYKSTDGGMSFTQVPLNSSISNIKDFFYGANGKFYFQVSGGVYETSDFQNVTAITATLPNAQQFRDAEISNNFLYAIVDSSIYRTPLLGGPASAPNQLSAANINVYPNPASGILNVQVPADMQVRKIELTDQLGRVLISENQQATTLDISRISAGVYFLNVRTREKILTQKVVIK